MVEARIDETTALTFRRLATSGRIIEEIAPFLGGAEYESRCQEHGRFDGTLRKQRIIAVPQHKRFRMQYVVCQPVLVIAVLFHGQSPGTDPPKVSRDMHKSPVKKTNIHKRSRKHDGATLRSTWDASCGPKGPASASDSVRGLDPEHQRDFTPPR